MTNACRTLCFRCIQCLVVLLAIQTFPICLHCFYQIVQLVYDKGQNRLGKQVCRHGGTKLMLSWLHVATQNWFFCPFCHQLLRRVSSTLHAMAISALAAYLILWTESFSDQPSNPEVLHLVKHSPLPSLISSARFVICSGCSCGRIHRSRDTHKSLVQRLGCQLGTSSLIYASYYATILG